MGLLVALVLAPFRLAAWLVRVIVGLVGRGLAVVIGVALVAVGVLLSLTVVGTVVGVPLAVVGVGLILRGLLP